MSSEDKVFDEADYQRQQQEAAEWCKTHPDPRHKYVAHYTFNNVPRTEEIWELNAEQAEAYVKSEWSKVGVYLHDLEIKEA